MIPGSFLTKLTVLAFFVAGALVYDFTRFGKRARRWKSYAFLIAAGVCGALLGGANDFFTSSLSSAYFAEWKALGYGPDLRLRSVILGSQAGFGVGLILSGALLFSNHYPPRFPGLSLPRLAAQLLFPVALSAALAGVLGSVYFLSSGDHAQRSRMAFAVWGIHTGLYVGAGLGMVAAVVRVQRIRRSGSG